MSIVEMQETSLASPSVLLHIDIKEQEDISRMEASIKNLLNCDGQQCAFLQSAPYKKMQIALLLKLNHIISQDAGMILPMGNGLVLYMHPCATKIEIYLKQSNHSSLPQHIASSVLMSTCHNKTKKKKTVSRQEEDEAINSKHSPEKSIKRKEEEHQDGITDGSDSNEDQLNNNDDKKRKKKDNGITTMKSTLESCFTDKIISMKRQFKEKNTSLFLPS